MEAAMIERAEQQTPPRAEAEGPDTRQVAELVERAMREDDADDPTLEHYQKDRSKP
jgi:hypothetical protein